MGKKEQLQWSTVRRRIDDLVPFAGNPRALDEQQLEALKKSLARFGLAEIPAIDTNNGILAGHARLKVLQLMGRGSERIDVRIPSRPLTAKEREAYLLTSNAVTGSWDFDLLRGFDTDLLLDIGFSEDMLANIFDDSLEVLDDQWDEEKEIGRAKKTTIKPGDHFALGRHRLLCGDALDPKTAQTLMGKVRADMVNDDLPYNIGLSYHKGVGGHGCYGGTTKDNKTDAEYRQFVKTVMQNALAVSKPDAHLFFWCDERYVWLFQELYKELGIDSKRLCIWLKDNASPVPQNAFNKVTEYVVYGTRGKPFLNDKIRNLNEVINKEVSSGGRLPDDVLDLLNIWLAKRLPGGELEHPTQKNPTVHEKALRRCTRPGDIVLDLTCGSGSILSACQQLGRTAYCADLEPVFCQVVINRFKKIAPNETIKKLN
jgi:site-specific DNA-methyltransferase (adenine-specific)